MIEMLIVVAILGILTAVALPSFQNTMEAANTNRIVKVMLTTLNLARSEAIKRGLDVSLCASTDGADCNGGTWTDGWLVFVDNNADADGSGGSVDVGDELIRVFDTTGGAATATFTVNLMAYNNLGFSAIGGTETFLVCPTSSANANDSNARSIVVGPSGRGRRVEDGLTCP